MSCCGEHLADLGVGLGHPLRYPWCLVGLEAGRFETVARPPAEYLDLDPPVPAPEEPFTALVLRGELSGNE